MGLFDSTRSDTRWPSKKGEVVLIIMSSKSSTDHLSLPRSVCCGWQSLRLEFPWYNRQPLSISEMAGWLIVGTCQPEMLIMAATRTHMGNKCAE